MLAGPGRETEIVYHGLQGRVNVQAVVLEEGVARRRFLRRRVRRLGAAAVLGQIGFRVLLGPYLRWEGRRRVAEILESQGLRDGPVDPGRVIPVSSVNHEETRRVLRRLEPDVVVIQGTRIVGEETLSAVEAPFVNLHTGITPAYRGVHGGYWALRSEEVHRFGVTVHLVDRGIDTGAVIAQETCWPTEVDNYYTYPYLQLAEGIPRLVEGIWGLYRGEVEPVGCEGRSRCWSHPTLGDYLSGRVFQGVR